jgi:mono/diheme cytochrome c family protein
MARKYQNNDVCIRNKTFIIIAMKRLITIALFTAFQLSSVLIAAQNEADLFTQNCGACHTIGKGKLVGPDLQGVDARHTNEWLIKWIKSSQTLVQAGDKQAVKLFTDNNSMPMPDQALTEEQIKIVISYIKAGGKTVAANDSNTATASTTQKEVATTEQKPVVNAEKADTLFALLNPEEYIFLSIIGLMLIVIYVLSMVIKGQAYENKE